jgi:hypothetical protein
MHASLRSEAYRTTKIKKRGTPLTLTSTASFSEKEKQEILKKVKKCFINGERAYHDFLNCSVWSFVLGFWFGALCSWHSICRKHATQDRTRGFTEQKEFLSMYSLWNLPALRCLSYTPIFRNKFPSPLCLHSSAYNIIAIPKSSTRQAFMSRWKLCSKASTQLHFYPHSHA